MQGMRLVALGLVIAALGCGDAPSELDENQGVCNDLEVNACKSDVRCQQAYINSAHQPTPTATKCLLVAQDLPTNAPCDLLPYESCRARNDCALIYWQDLGPTDAPVGDPYYKQCEDETVL